MKMAALDASLIDEPKDDKIVPMLEALSPEESLYYAAEENVLDMCGKSAALMADIEDHYAFVGGPLEEYIRYFKRPDLPRNMWTWGLEDSVKAVCGFSVVGKKNGHLRKLLMACSTNYCLDDVRVRADHGLVAGTAFPDCPFLLTY